MANASGPDAHVQGSSPTPLEDMDLPFAVEDDLVEPLAVFIVIHVHFIAPVSLAALEALRRALDEWLAITRRASGRAGDAGVGGSVI